MGTDFFLYFPDIRINIRTKPKIANTLIGSSRSLPPQTTWYPKYPKIFKIPRGSQVCIRQIRKCNTINFCVWWDCGYLRFLLKRVEKLKLQEKKQSRNVRENSKNELSNSVNATSWTYKIIVMICLRGGPLKSSLTRCSRIQMTTPIQRNEARTTHHSWVVKGLRKIQVPS